MAQLGLRNTQITPANIKSNLPIQSTLNTTGESVENVVPWIAVVAEGRIRGLDPGMLSLWSLVYFHHFVFVESPRQEPGFRKYSVLNVDFWESNYLLAYFEN